MYTWNRVEPCFRQMLILNTAFNLIVLHKLSLVVTYAHVTQHAK